MGIPASWDAAGGGTLGIPPAQFFASVREALGRDANPPSEPEPIHLAEDIATLESQAQAIRDLTAAELPTLMNRLAETGGAAWVERGTGR